MNFIQVCVITGRIDLLSAQDYCHEVWLQWPNSGLQRLRSFHGSGHSYWNIPARSCCIKVTQAMPGQSLEIIDLSAKPVIAQSGLAEADWEPSCRGWDQNDLRDLVGPHRTQMSLYATGDSFTSPQHAVVCCMTERHITLKGKYAFLATVSLDRSPQITFTQRQSMSNCH